ncbi:hypothetical protein EI94DRAFT_1704955 [Lactarius quietus]|nr:hypothetical protein EI94DRAFT_1704955 [Lactarius quietus]
MTSVETEKQHKVDKQSSVATNGGNEHYNMPSTKHLTLPDVFKFWEPLKEVKVVDRGLAADPEKKSLLLKSKLFFSGVRVMTLDTTKMAASKVITLMPARGTKLHGIDLHRLSDEQKDELSLLVAERGAVYKSRSLLGKIVRSVQNPMDYHPLPLKPPPRPSNHGVGPWEKPMDEMMTTGFYGGGVYEQSPRVLERPRPEHQSTAKGDSGGMSSRRVASPDSSQVFQNQDISIHEQFALGRHWGPLHKHTITPILQEPGLEEVRGLSF